MRFKLLAFLLLVCFQLVVVAQDSISLVIHIDGQVYRWSVGDAEPTFTGCDLQGNRLRTYDYSLTQSADSNWAAFMALPADMLDGAPSPTGNLWVCQIHTGEAYALSNRRPEFPYAVSEGAFSPDGNRIIWTEVENENANALTAAMLIHDFSTKATDVLVESLPLTEYCGIGMGAPRVIWGEQGIAVGYFEYNPDNPCNGSEEYGFSHYSADGTLLNSFPVQNTWFSDFEWLAGEEPRLTYWGWAETVRDPQLYTINMATGEIRVEDATLEAFIADNTASGSYTLLRSNAANYPPQIKLPASDVVLETSTDSALSPDGGQIAILLGRTLYYGENGTLTPAAWNQVYFPISDENAGLNIPDFRTGQLEVAWANPDYRLAPIPDTVCPTVERLSLEQGAFVIEGLGNNNVRSAPYANAGVIGVLEEGDFVFVIDAYDFSPFQMPPVDVCTEGIRWREILFEGQLGWTAESQGDTYFLETRG
jgi:hypothetical protein